MTAEITPFKQRGKPFQRGQSGNPTGRPKGARNRATLAAEALLDGEAEALTRKAIELALAGDANALRLCMERLLPPRRERPIAFALPAIARRDDIQPALSAIVAAVGSGQLSVTDGTALAQLVRSLEDRSLITGDRASVMVQVNFVEPQISRVSRE